MKIYAISEETCLKTTAAAARVDVMRKFTAVKLCGIDQPSVDVNDSTMAKTFET